MSEPAPLQSFRYPLRASAPWLAGSLLVLVWPVSFPVLLGYSVRALRESAADPSAPPPALTLSRRLLREGFLLGIAVLAISLPFAVAMWPLASALERSRLLPRGGDAGFDFAYSILATGFVLSLVWAVVMLLLLPTNAAAFAVSGRARDLFDPVAAGRRVRTRFVTWNVTTVVIVTAWLAAVASACLCCVGFLPGAFYAMLVSAHAAASLAQPEAT